MTKTPPGAALVTGGARRIGRAIVLALAARGHDVAIHHRDSIDDAEALAKEVRALGRRAVVVSADLTDEAETRADHESRWNSTPALWQAMLEAALRDFPAPPDGPRLVNIELPR